MPFEGAHRLVDGGPAEDRDAADVTGASRAAGAGDGDRAAGIADRVDARAGLTMMTEGGVCTTPLSVTPGAIVRTAPGSTNVMPWKVASAFTW
jgi:hypothetical protein